VNGVVVGIVFFVACYGEKASVDNGDWLL